MIKGKAKPQEQGEQPTYAENPEINQKIDEFIAKNPKLFEYYNSMPKDRLVRTAMLQQMNQQERKLRFENAVQRKLDQNPELKQAYQTIVKNLPEDQQPKAMVRAAIKTMPRGPKPTP